MTRWLAGFLLVPALGFPASAGSGTEHDTVRLKNGRVLCGVVVLDDSSRDGFTVQEWETGGTVFVRWTQIPEAERNRLTNRVAEAKAPGVMLDGVRAMTAGRDVVGILIKDDGLSLHIKTKDAKVPAQIPKSALLRPQEMLKIAEAEAYSPDEMVDLRVPKANEKDYAAMMDLGAFAASVKLYERAKEFYLKAQAADPSKKDDTDAVIAKNETLIKEGKAAALVAQVKEFVETIEFAKALETAKKLQSDFGDTEVARQNKDLPAQIEKKQKDYEDKRTEYLAENVPGAYRERRTALIAQAASSKNKIADALALAAKIDDGVVAELAKRMKATPEEIQTAWGKRDLTKAARTVPEGEGSWIVKGGQDGGLDTDAKTQPNQNNQNNNNNNGNMGGFGNGLGGRMMNNRNNNRNNQNNQPQPLGKKLETKDEWWAAASTTDRRALIEAEYAKASAAVKKEVKPKKCAVCNGEGIRKQVRSGVTCDCKCPRCHGAKEDDVVVYQ